MFPRRSRATPFRLPGSCPVTWAILAANALTFVTIFLGFGAVWSPLVFRSFALWSAPWTVVTYPLVSPDQVLWLLLGGYIFWLFGGSLERAWGWRDYTIFLLLVSAAPAIAVWAGGTLLGRGIVLTGLWLPLAASTVAWAAINPRERMMLYFVIPIEARWLAVLVAVFVVFTYPFPMGVFALAGCGVAWWYVRRGRYGLFRGRTAAAFGPPPRRRERSGIGNPLSWFRRWRLRRQFRRLIDESNLRDLEGKGPH